MDSMLLLALACGSQDVVVGDPNYEHEWTLPPDHDPIPFGFWGINGYQDAEGLADLNERFGLTSFHTSTRHPGYAVPHLLPLVQEAGMSVNLRLTGDHGFYTDDDGAFDLEAWKEMAETWRGAEVEPFIEDGTLAHHMLLDDLGAFAGGGPTGDQLDEMARFSEEVLPGLPTVVRQDASDLPTPSAGSYQHLDATINQYTAFDGDVESWALSEAWEAEELGLGVVMSLNIADGGSGASEQPGWTEGNWAMSAYEIEHKGFVLLAVPGCRQLLLWEYDAQEPWSDGTIGADYFDDPEMVEVIAWLGRLASGEEEAP